MVNGQVVNLMNTVSVLYLNTVITVWWRWFTLVKFAYRITLCTADWWNAAWRYWCRWHWIQHLCFCFHQKAMCFCLGPSKLRHLFLEYRGKNLWILMWQVTGFRVVDKLWKALFTNLNTHRSIYSMQNSTFFLKYVESCLSYKYILASLFY